MTPYYADDWLTVYHGDARAVMAEMPAESVHCVVTSPPYWGLRDYGTATWIGGDEGCDHKRIGSRGERPRSGLEGGLATVNHAQEPQFKEACGRCGAIRQDGQLGLEPTPEAYVANMVAVFREVRRVLRPDGTVWLNLGDSYAAQRGGTTMPAETLAGGEGGWMPDGGRVNRDRHDGYTASRNASAIGLKHKDLVGIPWRVAFALQADGWYLRPDIIWSKPNPMPESVTDRPTKSHEYLFLLSKSARYYFDSDAVREAGQDWSSGGPGVGIAPTTHYHPNNGGNEGLAGIAARYKTGEQAAGRNIRSVWTIATAPYPGAHFATFPPKLVEPCIKAGCPEGATVLDPFAGSGTTGMVAQSLSRRAVLIDLSMDYLEQLMDRNRDIPLGLAQG